MKIKSDLFGSVLTGSAVVAVSKVSGVGLLFVMQIVLARILSDPEQYGLIVWSVSVVQILAVVATLGMTTTVLRFAPGYLAGNKVGCYFGLLKMARISVLMFGIAICAFLLIWLLGVVPDGSPKGDVMAVMTLAIPLAAIGRLNGGIAQANRWFILAFLPERVLRPVFVIVGCGLAYVVFARTIQAVSAAWIIILSTAVWVSVQAVLVRKGNIRVGNSICVPAGKDCPAKRMKTEWRRASVPFLIVSILSIGMHYGDVLLLGIISNASETGEYFAASRLSQLVALPLVIVAGALAPRIAEFDNLGERKKLQTVLETGAHLSFWPTLVMAIIMAAYPSFFLGLFGDEYAGAEPVLLLLVLAQICNVAMGLVVTVINMTGNQRINAYLLAAILALNIILNLALIPMYGALGAGLANAISFLLWNVSAYVFVNRWLGLEPSILASIRR